jgi:O-antigen/teichoic acid export membrane protein
VWYATLLVAQVAGCYLNAVEQSRRTFVAQVAQTAAVVLVTLPLTAVYGLDGLMLGGVLGNLVMVAAYLAAARKVAETDEQAHERFIINEMQASATAAPTVTRLAA